MDKKLTRDPDDKMIGGVASGVAKYFQLDVSWVRIAFALATLFGASGFLIYVILWIAVPEDSKPPYVYTDYRMEKDEPIKPVSTKRNSNMNIMLGFILIVMGAYFLLDEFEILPYWFQISKLWPLIFVAFGLMILSKARKSKEAEGKDEKIADDVFNETENDNK